MNDKKYWVWLGMIFGGGCHRLWQLMNICETAQEACSEILSDSRFINLTDSERKNINSYSLKNAEELIAVCGRMGIGIAAYSENEYPNQLRYIADPPPVLFYKGNIGCLTGTKTITSVGTRRAGDYSISTCRRVCSELARKGFVIVSGFAVGIDITSHMAAAELGLPTACVLGCGVDVDYPKENFRFRDKIIASGGVFVSEYPPGTRPHRGSFPKRNRILSALGRAAVVFEAAENSGSIITAKLAAEQGRELFVLPPADIFSSSFGGNIRLLREGAVPVMSVEDIMDFFKPGSSADAYIKSDAFAYVIDTKPSRRMEAPKVSRIHELMEQEEVISSENNERSETPQELADNKNKADDEISFDSIPEGLARDIAMLLCKEGRLHADVICTKLGIDSARLMIELTELEIIGAVRACPGRLYEFVS